MARSMPDNRKEATKLHCPQLWFPASTILQANNHLLLYHRPLEQAEAEEEGEIHAHLPRMDRWEQALVVQKQRARKAA